MLFHPPAGKQRLLESRRKNGDGPMLTKPEKDRYSRQLLISGWGLEAQQKLKNSSVFVAGTGGLGSAVLLYLAAAGVGCLRFCDNDRVELSNLNRQILHRTGNIGAHKTDSAMEALGSLNPNVRLVPYRDTITSKNIDRVAGDACLMVDCLDNFATRHILNRYSVERSVPLLHAGISDMRGQMTLLQPPETPCLACFYPSRTKKEVFPVVGATAGVIGSLQALEALKFLTGCGDTLRNRLLFWSGREMRFDIISVARNPRCGVCGVKKRKSM